MNIFFPGLIPLLFLMMLAPVTGKAEQTFFLRTLEAYHPTYVLNSWFLNGEGGEQDYDDKELLIQFSFKKQVYKVLYFGFTYKAFWQIYDVNDSRPFREQNYNPEGFLEFEDIWGLDLFRLGLIEHESNGEKQRYDENQQLVNHSRSWDRSYFYLWKNLGNYFGLGMKAWVVTSSKQEELQAYYQDNADLQSYMGSGELYASVGQYPTVLTFMFRRGWSAGTDTYRVEGRLPLYHLFDMKDRGYDIFVHYFSGYGNSLIDYDRKIERIAIGISFR